jgi:hypothetical protein
MTTPKTPLDLIAEDIAWDKPSPCADCPFLKTTPFHLGVAGSIPSYFESIGNNSFAHTCHKTDNRPACDGPKNHVGKVQHCVGAILMLLKTGKGMDLQLPLLKAAEAGKVDLAARMRQAKKWKNVYTVRELIAFYESELAKRVGKKVSVIA